MTYYINVYEGRLGACCSDVAYSDEIAEMIKFTQGYNRIYRIRVRFKVKS